MSEQGFSGTRAAEVVGITYRQLDYWARTDLVRPSMADARGSGSRRRYSYRDLLELKMIKKLLDSGIRLEQVRDVFRNLRQHLESEIVSANVVISGTQVALCDTDGQLIDLVRSGQGVLNVLSVAGVKEELDADLVDLRPTVPDPVRPLRRAAQA